MLFVLSLELFPLAVLPWEFGLWLLLTMGVPQVVYDVKDSMRPWLPGGLVG